MFNGLLEEKIDFCDRLLLVLKTVAFAGQLWFFMQLAPFVLASKEPPVILQLPDKLHFGVFLDLAHKSISRGTTRFKWENHRFQIDVSNLVRALLNR